MLMMFDGAGITMICCASYLPLRLTGRMNECKIPHQVRLPRSAVGHKPSLILLQTNGTSNRSGSRRLKSGTSRNPAFSLANTVGVLGGVSASTVHFLEKLVKWSSGDEEQGPPFIACSDPVLSKELSTCERSSYPYPTSRNTPYQFDQSVVVENLRLKRLFLERSGAQCIVMPCHISHMWYDEVSRGCSVQFLHIGESIAKELKSANLKPIEAGSNLRIGVLATEAVLASGFYQEKLKDMGFEVILLDKATMEHTVLPAIEAFAKGDTEGASNLLRIALQLLLVRAVNTIIIGSSEFHGILPPDDPLLHKCTNPMDALVRSAIQWAKSTEAKG